jgi:hypothetical protein
VDASAHRVDAWWQPPLTDVDAATYLLGPVLAFAMRLRGLVPLHASGVAIDGRAVLFAGTPGAGKSTTAAAFASLGVPVLSDDVVPVLFGRAEPQAWPGYPRLSLWADAAQAVFGETSPLPAYSATYAKRYLDLEGRQLPFQRTPLPIGAVFVLDGHETPMDRLAPRDAVVALLRHTYGTYLIDMELRAREFDLLARLAAAVPVWRLRWGTELGDLTRRCLALGTTSVIPSTVARSPRCRFERSRCVALQETTPRAACPGRREALRGAAARALRRRGAPDEDRGTAGEAERQPQRRQNADRLA